MLTFGRKKERITRQALFPAAAHAEQKRNRGEDIKALPRLHRLRREGRSGWRTRNGAVI